MSDALVFAFSLVDTGAILFLLVYYVITLSDLECDYLNAQQCCERLNCWLIPKLTAHAVLIPLFALYGYWLLAAINLPIVLWMAYQQVTVPSGNTGLYEPTEIYNRGQLKKHMKHCMIYLGWYMISFFIYLYCMIIALLNEKPPMMELDTIETGEF